MGTPPIIDKFLIPQGTVLIGKGETEALDLGESHEKHLLLSLAISEVVEQESLDLALYGSTDGATWSDKPLASFPQQFYPGETPLLADVGGVRFVRAHWEANRWGRGSMETMFKVSLRVREVPREVLDK
jgi:hypothetical protein